ncbi:uncharacterized protein N7515_006686 [Penicillium bovifimosum]|uniref:histidine kinase n=1 Tax=Penicillium bovifimosum TaxID=126998 RepID=A0A9W9GV48_9EURO|nr:uncharacterized protein N7515_006686 [Penicillium bovifimosum]KAJ5130647.1 hypothetical protein N7515_006686 [Penicillium bovifimosum]
MKSSTDDDHHAGRRAREVYRYFQPDRLAPIDENRSLASDGRRSADCSTGRDLASASTHNRSPSLSLSPISKGLSQFASAPGGRTSEALSLGSANATLNSFAQLAALRLNMDRVFVSVSDRQSQYIIAQSLQTAKENCDHDSAGQTLYSGCVTLDVGSWTPCQDTISLPNRKRGKGTDNFIVSNDLSQDARYKDLPFVQGKPNFRFYAGTPLTTERNINIGCFFVLDTKPHADFDESEKEIMTTMSTLIMDFLKVSRQASEGRRATRLSRGLSCFVEGGSSFLDTFEDSASNTIDLQYTTPPTSRSRASRLSVTSQNQSSRRSGSPASDAGSTSSMGESRGDRSLCSSVDSRFPGLRTGNRHKSRDEHIDNTYTFQRAANLIRESLELDGDSGVVFVEGGSDTALDYEANSDNALEGSRAASVLSISTGDNALGPATGSMAQFPVSGIDQVFMHGLLNRYAQGKIWSFHRDGLLSSSDSEDSPRESRSRIRKEHRRSKRPQKWKTTENTLLNRFFPGATQVMFVPLWNAANSQWFGGCFCWNNVESIVFDTSVELSSVLGFGSSIMAECNRIEAHISDRQKADFLGSVSHELRSPLHGVMAAAELLQSTLFDDFQGSLLETINACGRTLLDTMNQVLDYTKLVSLEKDLRHLKKNLAPHMDIQSMQRSAGHLDTYMTTDISLLTEEVVEGVSLGHSYSQRPVAPADPSGAALTKTKNPEGLNIPQLHVDVIIDIEPNDWVYYTPPGALRRIIMNIFSNAVKYTDSGHVSLHLEAKKAPENWSQPQGMKEDLIALTVTDTGRGMSADFLRGRLFVPFAQENSLSVGTGLGLSIVRSLVKTLGGSVNVDSRPGEGTTVKVVLPLTREEHEDYSEVSDGIPSPPQEETDSITNDVRLLRDNNAGRKVAILGVEPDDAPNHPLWGPVSRYLTCWYGLELVSSSSRAPIDIILVEELPVEKDKNWGFSDKQQAVLVLSCRYVGHNSLRAKWSSLAKVVSIVSRPCGPHKLARFIRKCFEQGSSLCLPDRTITSEQDTEVSSESVEVSSDGDMAPKENAETSHLDDVPSISLNSPTPPPSIGTEPPESAPVPSSTEAAEMPPRSCTPRVLVVEDNKINLNLMLAFLKKRKLDTLDSAENGQLAVDAVKQAPQGYDIIFMDISMPVMDGFNAARSIRTLERQRGPYSQPAVIIALTGLSGSNDELEALSSGMDMFLTKPVTLKNVSKILDKWSDRGFQDD